MYYMNIVMKFLSKLFNLFKRRRRDEVLEEIFELEDEAINSIDNNNFYRVAELYQRMLEVNPPQEWRDKHPKEWKKFTSTMEELMYFCLNNRIDPAYHLGGVAAWPTVEKTEEDLKRYERRLYPPECKPDKPEWEKLDEWYKEFLKDVRHRFMHNRPPKKRR